MLCVAILNPFRQDLWRHFYGFKYFQDSLLLRKKDSPFWTQYCFPLRLYQGLWWPFPASRPTYLGYPLVFSLCSARQPTESIGELIMERKSKENK